VIPFDFKTKKPSIPWAEFQTRRPGQDELYEWFSRGRRNIGVVCGKVSGGLVVIDFDGEDTFQRFAQEHPEIVNNTWVAKTARGYHVYLRTKEPPRPAHRGKIDIKGEGSVVLVPPSVHPSGAQYRWIRRTKEILYVESLPTLRGVSKENDKPPATTIPATIQEGERNTTLISIAGTLRRLGLKEGEIRELLLIVNAVKAKPPLSSKEVATIAHSASRYPPHPPRCMRRGGPEEHAACVSRQLAKRGLEPELRLALLSKLSQLRGWNIAEERLRDIAEHPPISIDKLAQRAVELLDPQLAKAVSLTLCGVDGTEDLPIDERRGLAGQLVVEWLQNRGFFTRSETEELFYFHREEKRAYKIDEEEFAYFLYSVSGVNPASRHFPHLLEDCMAIASRSEPRKVVRVSYYDRANDVLYVSRFDGTVYVLDGNSITTEDNGAHVIFVDNPRWQPYNPEGGNGLALDWLWSLPNWDGDREAYKLLGKVWSIALLFSELCPAKPLVVLVGEKGSGKTLTMRLLLRLLFGSNAEVSGMPDRPDGLRAAASASHILALDNLDGLVPWARDMIARMATGAVDPTRKLYTTNTMHEIRYRTWLAFTSRDPKTFQRDDLADRAIILPLQRIPENEWKAESDLLEQAETFRNDFWGDLLDAANKIVAYLKRSGLPHSSPVRMADFERFGRVVAQVLGEEATWARSVAALLKGQAELMLDDPLVEALLLWLEDRKNQGREISGRILYDELTRVYWGEHKPSRDWPKDARAMGRRLQELTDSLYRRWGVTTVRTHTKSGTIYRFSFAQASKGERR
jgi:hypothetical protein